MLGVPLLLVLVLLLMPAELPQSFVLLEKVAVLVQGPLVLSQFVQAHSWGQGGHVHGPLPFWGESGIERLLSVPKVGGACHCRCHCCHAGLLVAVQVLGLLRTVPLHGGIGSKVKVVSVREVGLVVGVVAVVATVVNGKHLRRFRFPDLLKASENLLDRVLTSLSYDEVLLTVLKTFFSLRPIYIFGGKKNTQT